MQRFNADLWAARFFLSMLDKERAISSAEHHPIYNPDSARKMLLLLHGLTLPGESDPILENLKEFRFDFADRDCLLEVSAHFQEVFK